MNKAPATAFVLCAGLGTRLRPYTDTLPKPMVPVAGRPLLDYTLDHLQNAGVTTTVINTHHKADVIRAYAPTRTHPTITLIHEDTLLDTGGGVKAALPLLGHAPFYVINGDALWTDYAGGSVLGDLATAFNPDLMDMMILLSPAADGKGDYHLEPGGRVTRAHDKTGAHMFTGVRLCSPVLFDNSPEGAFSFLVLMDRAQEAGRLYGRPMAGEWHHISTPADLERTDRLFASRKAVA